MKSSNTLLNFFTKTIDTRFSKAFATKMHYSNIEQCYLFSLVGLILVTIQMPIHVIRYQSGTLLSPEFPNQRWFLFFHLVAFLNIFVLFFSRKAKKEILKGENYFNPTLINLTLLLQVFVLLGIEIMTLYYRKGTATYSIFIIFTNLAFKMNNRNRFLFNLGSLVFICLVIIFFIPVNNDLKFILLSGPLTMTTIAYIIGTSQYNSAISQFENSQLLEAERKKSDDLLSNILPQGVIEELKKEGNIKAKSYDEVTIMFCDFKDFSKISKQLSAEDLVVEIDYCFSKFDEIIARYPIEKIKTIGDAYLCACGLPYADTNHALIMLQAAQDLQQFMQIYAAERSIEGKPHFTMRVGIHSGTVVAGIVGTRKFAYDIWGDAVNIAARIENACEVGKIYISDDTYQHVQGRYDCTLKTAIELKNIGKMNLWAMEASEASEN
jgi:class 3 adenylate cyclase